MEFQPWTFLRYLHKLRRDQWLKPSIIQENQLKNLRAILEYAYSNVRFYHQLFESVGIKPMDIKDVADLSKIPMTTKLNVQENFPNNIVARNIVPEKCARRSTSGSTGIPLTILFDKKAINYRWALDTRPMLENGLRLRDKQAVFQTRPPPKLWFDFMVWRCRFFPAAEQPETHIPMLRSYHPDVIRGYPEYLALIAKTLGEGEVNDIHPRLVFCVAQLLSKRTRDSLQSVFGTGIYDLYGCWEFGNMAWECNEHAGYHLSEGTIMEFVRDGEIVGPGERGTIVCTGLYNHAMPLIRYQVGDVGVAGTEYCPCGRGLPLIRSIEGRSDDFVVTTDGKIFSPSTFSNVMLAIQGISQFRIIQEKRNRMTVQIVKGRNFSPATINQVLQEIKTVVGDEMDVIVETVEEIPMDRSGKIRRVISKVRFQW